VRPQESPRILGWRAGGRRFNIGRMNAHSPEEIHALIGAAFNAADREGLAQLYEEDATVIGVPPEGGRVSGRDAILAATEPIFALEPTARLEVVEKLEGDGLAMAQGRWRIAGTNDGEPVEMSGRGTLVSRRQPDGAWRVVLERIVADQDRAGDASASST
jgi:uncharacterized protein (TIGR02246 family)